MEPMGILREQSWAIEVNITFAGFLEVGKLVIFLV